MDTLYFSVQPPTKSTVTEILPATRPHPWLLERPLIVHIPAFVFSHSSRFKDGGTTLIAAITQLFIEIWHSEDVPGCWGESIVIPIFKKGKRTVCSNHRGVSLIPIISKLFASILLRRLTPSREQTIREQQGGFRPGRGCVDLEFVKAVPYHPFFSILSLMTSFIEPWINELSLGSMF